MSTKQTASLDKLPRWARIEIERLRSDLESTESRLCAALGEVKTNVEVDPYLHHINSDAGRCYLPDHTTVRFTLKSGETIDVHMRDGVLEIRGTGTQAAICVLPHSGNVIHVCSAK